MASPSSRYRRWTHLWLASTRAPRYQSLLTTDGRTTFVRFKRRAAGRYTPRKLERLREPGFQEFAQLGRSLELWDGIQFLECRGERIRKTPDRSRAKFLVLWLEVEVMYAAGKVLWSLQSALDKCLVDDHLGGHLRGVRGRQVGSSEPPGPRRARPLLRAKVRGVPTANDLESFECVHFCIQGTGSYSTIQGYGQAGRIPGSPVLAVVLACGACIGRPPFF